MTSLFRHVDCSSRDIAVGKSSDCSFAKTLDSLMKQDIISAHTQWMSRKKYQYTAITTAGSRKLGAKFQHRLHH